MNLVDQFLDCPGGEARAYDCGDVPPFFDLAPKSKQIRPIYSPFAKKLPNNSAYF